MLPSLGAAFAVLTELCWVQTPTKLCYTMIRQKKQLSRACNALCGLLAARWLFEYNAEGPVDATSDMDARPATIRELVKECLCLKKLERSRA
jgi:hypothetical protein